MDKFLQWEEDDFTQSENKRECIPAVELLRYQIPIFSQGGYLNMAHENKPDISKSNTSFVLSFDVTIRRELYNIKSKSHSLGGFYDLPCVTRR